MINREDMLALTRRMTVKRTSITRIAGGYMDIDGFIDGTFNTSFLKLSPAEQEKNLALAKKVPFAKTNKNLKEYKFSDDQRNPDSMWKLLMGMRACGLKNDALMELESGTVLYEKNADEMLRPASVTKVMTLLLIFEALERGDIALDDTVVVTEHAASMGG